MIKWKEWTKRQKVLYIVYLIAMINLIGINHMNIRRDNSESYYYTDKIIRDILVDFDIEKIAYIENRVMFKGMDPHNMEVYKYTDLGWLEAERKQKDEYYSQMQYESDVIIRKQNNELFEPSKKILQSISQLEEVQDDTKLNSPDVKMEFKFKVHKKPIKFFPEEHVFLLECYLKEELIIIKPSEKYTGSDYDSGRYNTTNWIGKKLKMTPEIKSSIGQMKMRIEERNNKI